MTQFAIAAARLANRGLSGLSPIRSGSTGAMRGAIIGPTLGGWLTDNFGWRWCFYINLPVRAWRLRLHPPLPAAADD